MQTKTISRFEEFSEEDVLAISSSLRNKECKIFHSKPDENNLPTGIFDFLSRTDSYKLILNDTKAFLNCYGLEVEVNDNTLLKVPLGMYGVSPSHKIQFPIVAGDIIKGLITMDKDTFTYLMGTDSNLEINEVYKKFLDVKEWITKKILSSYMAAQTDYHSVIAWPIRTPESFTRQCAESLDCKRTEVSELEAEFYYPTTLPSAVFEYIKQSADRWRSIAADDAVKSNLSQMDDVKMGSLFYSNLVMEKVIS